MPACASGLASVQELATAHSQFACYVLSLTNTVVQCSNLLHDCIAQLRSHIAAWSCSVGMLYGPSIITATCNMQICLNMSHKCKLGAMLDDHSPLQVQKTSPDSPTEDPHAASQSQQASYAVSSSIPVDPRLVSSPTAARQSSSAPKPWVSPFAELSKSRPPLASPSSSADAPPVNRHSCTHDDDDAPEPPNIASALGQDTAPADSPSHPQQACMVSAPHSSAGPASAAGAQAANASASHQMQAADAPASPSGVAVLSASPVGFKQLANPQALPDRRRTTAQLSPCSSASPQRIPQARHASGQEEATLDAPPSKLNGSPISIVTDLSSPSALEHPTAAPSSLRPLRKSVVSSRRSSDPPQPSRLSLDVIDLSSPSQSQARTSTTDSSHGTISFSAAFTPPSVSTQRGQSRTGLADCVPRRLDVRLSYSWGCGSPVQGVLELMVHSWDTRLPGSKWQKSGMVGSDLCKLNTPTICICVRHQGTCFFIVDMPSCASLLGTFVTRPVTQWHILAHLLGTQHCHA